MLRGFVRLSLTRGYHPEAPITGFPPLVLYGGGHVGQALARARAPALRTHVAGRARQHPGGSGRAGGAGRKRPRGALHYVMTHDHSLDLDIVSALLRRSEAEVPFIGMIGSHTKIAASQPAGDGVSDETQARPITPIGIGGIRGKEPAVIAAAVAAEALLLSLALQRLSSRSPAFSDALLCTRPLRKAPLDPRSPDY